MSVLLTGSIAYDTVLSHEGTFARQFVETNLANLNTTFLARGMRRDFGGCAANIAVSMKRLGGDPVLWGTVGTDGDAYLERFRSMGIRTDGIAKLEDAYTAQCFILTDANGCQLGAFHPGATERTPEVPWPVIDGEKVRPTVAILSPGGRATTLHAAKACTERGVPYIFDVGQELPLFSGRELTEILMGSIGIAYSEYESQLFEAATGLSPAAIAAKGKFVLRTLGKKGAELLEAGTATPQFIETVPVKAVSAVGAGDAMRGGLLAGLSMGLSLLESARLGAVASAHKVAAATAQDYQLDLETARRDYASVWGEAPF